MSPDEKATVKKARAKINLTFEVLGQRSDGYHEVVSVMQTITMCDVLIFEPRDDIRLVSDVADLVSPANLVYKAARLMQGLAGNGHGVSVALSKGIPLASGLGGGSSDAAVTLQTLNKMWGVNLPRKGIVKVAAQLGSDVPFFVSSHHTALATGRGEKVAALPSPPSTSVVLLRPPIQIPNKTRYMYAHLDPAGFTGGQHGRSLADSMKAGERLTNRQCFNAFGRLAFSLFPKLDDYRREFLAAGADEVHLAGAGPTLFTLAASRDEGRRILGRLIKQRMEAYLAETL